MLDKEQSTLCLIGSHDCVILSLPNDEEAKDWEDIIQSYLTDGM